MPPAGWAPGEVPIWIQVSDGQTWAYHDHRAHWMATSDPDLEDPAQRQVVNEWSVPILVDGNREEVNGDLVWLGDGG